MLVLHWWQVVVIIGLIVHFFLPEASGDWFDMTPLLHLLWVIFWFMLTIIFALAFH